MTSFRIAVIAAWYSISIRSFRCYWYFDFEGLRKSLMVTIFDEEYDVTTVNLDTRTIRELDVLLRNIEYRRVYPI